MAKQIVARNSSRSRTHRRVRGLGLLLVVDIVVSLAMLLAACDSTASSGTSSQSEDVPVEEQAAQDNDKPEPQVEPETQAETEATTNNEASGLSAEEIAEYRAEVQRRHREQPCWVTLSGHSYHESKTCPELDGSMGLIEMTVGEAIDGGYDPCWCCAY